MHLTPERVVWVLASLMLGVTLRWTSIPSRDGGGGVEILPVVSSYRHQDKLWPDGPQLACIQTSPVPFSRFHSFTAAKYIPTPFTEVHWIKTLSINPTYATGTKHLTLNVFSKNLQLLTNTPSPTFPKTIQGTWSS